MKKCITLRNVICFIILTLSINSYVLVRLSPYSLIAIIPAFILLNFLPGSFAYKDTSLRLKICNHGAVILAIFTWSLIPSCIWHIVLGFLTVPDRYSELIFSVIYCIVASAIVFWNGMISVYCTSSQMGIKWRVIGALCGMIPILNLIVLTKIINITANEVEFEIEKEKIMRDPSLSELCKTKYPLIFVHGVFFRDSNFFNYWGRIPRTLKMHGATVYYGNHQSALPVKESARELASRIKLLIDRYGYEKVNLIAHSKGGLDCRYAISEFGLATYVASLTTVNTPHRGCIFVEKILSAVPEKTKNSVASAYNVTLTALGDECPDFLAAVGDLTAESCEKLNGMLKTPDEIFTQSIGSVMNTPKSGRFPMNLSYRYVKNFDGENDGLVGENSFSWGEKYTLLRTENKRGISHADMIDLNRENIRDFDVRDFYVKLVCDLKERGF